MTNIKKCSFVASVLLTASLSIGSSAVYAQEGADAPAAKPAAPVGPVICPGYKRGKTKLVGQSVGKKVQKAFEAYNEDRIQEAVDILSEVETDDEFDSAYVGRFLGNMLAGMEGNGQKALGYLVDAAEPKVLNDTEHASLLKLVGDLSMQEKEYLQAVDYYEKWMTFTCKEDPDVYTRMAQAFYESKKWAEIVAPADKAIATYKKPNKNPYILKLQAFYERKMFKEATGVAEQLVINFPEEPRWWSQLGFFYLSSENYSKALSAFEIAYNAGFLKKKSEIQALSQLYGVVGIPHKAAEILKKHIDSGLVERTKDTLARVANAHHQARDYKSAAKVYGEAAKLESDPEMYQKQGTLLLIAEDYKGAIRAFKSALDNGAENVGTLHYSLMEANFHAGDYKQAYVHVKEAKKDRTVRRNANAWIPYIETKAKNNGIRL